MAEQGSVKMRALLAALIIAIATPASALVCGKRDAIVAALAAQYGEQPIGAGITANGSLIEMFFSEDGSTWTRLLTGPGGASCVIADGEAWEPAKPKGDDA